MEQKEVVAEKVWIPEVSVRRIRELAKRIRPVVRFCQGAKGLYRSPHGKRHYIKPVSLHTTAYTWDPVPTMVATGLKRICDITTYHSWSYYGFFKPSIAEVLAQIPEEHLDKVVAFEIVQKPESMEDMRRESEAFNAGFHVAKTRLYALA
jgi:hypothetical protein